MASPTVAKPMYLDANGTQRPFTGTDVASVPALQVTALTTASGVLQSDGSGNITSAKVVNANVDASAAIDYSKLALTGSVVNADISASAAIAYSKLALTGSIVNADIGASAAIAYSKLSLSGSIVNADISASAAIAYSKLSLSGSIVNADVASGAAIAYSKLNLGSSIVNNDVASGAAIAYSKLNLTASIVDADIASGQNIAFYNAATPTFANALAVGSPTLSGHATTKTYVDTAINNAIAGLDYKQEAQVYFEVPSGSGITTIAGIVSLMNGTTGVFTTGTRSLINFETADVESGIYTITGSDGAWTLTRASDMAATSDAAGAYIFCTQEFDGSALAAYNKALVCQQAKGSAVVGTNTLTFAIYGVGSTYTFNAPLSESGGTVSLSINSDTLEVASSALKVSGLPSGFKINGNAVSANVTQTNVDTLVNGTSSDATALHRHAVVTLPYPRASAITAGKTVTVSGGNAVTASKTDGKVIGVVYNDTGSNVNVATSGSIVITSPTGSPSAGDNLYINTSGDLCTYATLSSGDYVTKVGKYVGLAGPGNTPMIAIAIQEFGIKP